jgi:thiol-disulfide isomerase/thioredoxin/small nuclear ribonucleoprotein (snRNP)-like protein
MPDERLHNSLRWLSALVAWAPLLALQMAAHGAERGAGNPSRSLLVLAGGDRLRGTLVACDEPTEIAWQSPAFVEPLRFPLTAVQAIKLDAPTTAAHGEYRIELPGGDELHGTLVSIDKSAIVVATKWGTWRAKRSAVVSVSHLHRALRRRGKPPATEKTVAQKTHVVLTTNKVVYAELAGYDARSTAFSFQGQGTSVTYRANDIAEIVFTDAGPNRDPVRLECSEGTRLSGQLVKVADGNALVSSSSLLDTVTVPVAALRSIQASASGTSQPRLGDDALFVFGEDRLRGQLVAAEPKAGRTPFAWQPSSSSHAATIRAGIAASIDFGRVDSAAIGDDPVLAEDRVFLRGGDVLKCRISAIDADNTLLSMAGSGLTQMSNTRIKAVELGPHSRGAIADDKLTRLLTVPRLQKNDPPTHVLGSLADDYLRGQLIAVSDDRVWFQVGTTRREFPRDRIASIVWLDSSSEPPSDAAGGPDEAAVVHVTDAEGLSLRLASSRVDDGAIVGTNELLGDCRFPLDRLGALRFGPASARGKFARRYVTWKLTSAIEPKAFAEDAAGEGQGDESDLVGQAAPDFVLMLLDGSQFRLSAQRGKVVILDFWASWCAPCVKGLPEVAALSSEFDSDRVRFVAVNVQEARDDAAQATERLKLDVPVALDLDGRVAARYGAASIPYTVVVGPDGKFIRVFTGYGPRLADELKGAIGDALK